jgi:hypothetical protein
MKRILTYAIALTAALLFSGLSQAIVRAQGGAGAGSGMQSGTAGQMGTGQTGTAGQMGTGQTGTAGQMGTGQTGTAGQFGTGQTGTAGQFQGVVPPGLRNQQVPNQGVRFPELFGANPWFMNPQVQQQLRLSPNQVNQLSQAHRNALNRFQQQAGRANNAGAAAAGLTGNAAGIAPPGSAAGNGAVGVSQGGTAATARGTAVTGGTNPATNRSAVTPTPSGAATTRSTTGASADRSTTSSATRVGAGTATTAGTTGTSVGTTGTGTATGGAGVGTTTGSNQVGTASGSNTVGTATGSNQFGTSTTGAGATGAAGANVAPPGRLSANADASAQFDDEFFQSQQQFFTDFDRELNSVFTDPQQRARFNQLAAQFRGFDALLDPGIRQRLNLSTEQVQQLAQFRRDWFQQMADIRRLPPTQREQAILQFNQLRAEMLRRIGLVLTDQQRQIWVDITGEPFQFEFDTFFSPAGTTQDFQEENRLREQSGAAGGTTSTMPGATVPRESTIGIGINPGSNIGTAANPGTGSGVGTAANPGAGSGVGTGSTTDRSPDRR